MDVAIAFGLALVSMLVAPLLDLDGDARHLRVVRRRVRRTRRENQTDVPGVILFEIDGLGEGVLREAIRDGHAPTIARWLSDGTPPDARLGVRPLLTDRSEPGGAADRQQLGHARIPLV